MADSNLLETYNPLYDVHLRQYFASPHMQKHLRSLGLLDSNGVPIAQQDNNVEGQLYARHQVMMDMMLRNKERVLMQLADLQKKLDAAEKVEIYRRIRSGITNAEEFKRHHLTTRSFSRPARGRAREPESDRQRRNSYDESELVKRIENDFDAAQNQEHKGLYNRLAANAYKYQYLHKLDDRTLINYKESLRRQLQKLERFREVSFGPHSVARHQPNLQTSWFFRRRSLPSLTTANTTSSGATAREKLPNFKHQRNSKSGNRQRAGKSCSPHRANRLPAATQSAQPTQRKSKPKQAPRKLPPLPKQQSKAKTHTSSGSSSAAQKLPPTAVVKPSKKREKEIENRTSSGASVDKLPQIAAAGVLAGGAIGAATALTVQSDPEHHREISDTDYSRPETEASDVLPSDAELSMGTSPQPHSDVEPEQPEFVQHEPEPEMTPKEEHAFSYEQSSHEPVVEDPIQRIVHEPVHQTPVEDEDITPVEEEHVRHVRSIEEPIEPEQKEEFAEEPIEPEQKEELAEEPTKHEIAYDSAVYSSNSNPLHEAEDTPRSFADQHQTDNDEETKSEATHAEHSAFSPRSINEENLDVASPPHEPEDRNETPMSKDSMEPDHNEVVEQRHVIEEQETPQVEEKRLESPVEHHYEVEKREESPIEQHHEVEAQLESPIEQRLESPIEQRPESPSIESHREAHPEEFVQEHEENYQPSEVSYQHEEVRDTHPEESVQEHEESYQHEQIHHESPVQHEQIHHESPVQNEEIHHESSVQHEEIHHELPVQHEEIHHDEMQQSVYQENEPDQMSQSLYHPSENQQSNLEEEETSSVKNYQSGGHRDSFAESESEPNLHYQTESLQSAPIQQIEEHQGHFQNNFDLSQDASIPVMDGESWRDSEEETQPATANAIDGDSLTAVDSLRMENSPTQHESYEEMAVRDNDSVQHEEYKEQQENYPIESTHAFVETHEVHPEETHSYVESQPDEQQSHPEETHSYAESHKEEYQPEETHSYSHQNEDTQSMEESHDNVPEIHHETQQFAHDLEHFEKPETRQQSAQLLAQPSIEITPASDYSGSRENLEHVGEAVTPEVPKTPSSISTQNDDSGHPTEHDGVNDSDNQLPNDDDDQMTPPSTGKSFGHDDDNKYQDNNEDDIEVIPPPTRHSPLTVEGENQPQEHYHLPESPDPNAHSIVIPEQHEDDGLIVPDVEDLVPRDHLPEEDEQRFDENQSQQEFSSNYESQHDTGAESHRDTESFADQQTEPNTERSFEGHEERYNDGHSQAEEMEFLASNQNSNQNEEPMEQDHLNDEDRNGNPLETTYQHEYNGHLDNGHHQMEDEEVFNNGLNGNGVAHNGSNGYHHNEENVVDEHTSLIRKSQGDEEESDNEGDTGSVIIRGSPDNKLEHRVDPDESQTGASQL